MEQLATDIEHKKSSTASKLVRILHTWDRIVFIGIYTDCNVVQWIRQIYLAMVLVVPTRMALFVQAPNLAIVAV